MSEGQYPRVCAGRRIGVHGHLCGKALTAPATVAPQQPRALLSSQQRGSDVGGCCVWGGQQLCFFLLEQRSQSLPLPHPHNPTPEQQQPFQTFCLKCKSSLFQMGSLRLEQTSALPQTWACFCLPRMPESAWQGCVCLQSGPVPWLPGETCSLSGRYPRQGVASSLHHARC